jgi:hypothetical protein
VTKQITRLASGEGVPHPRASAVFMKAQHPHCPSASPAVLFAAVLCGVESRLLWQGQPITLGEDFLTMIDAAQEWEACAPPAVAPFALPPALRGPH